MTYTRVTRNYLIPGKKTQALEVWAKAVADGTTEEYLQSIVVREEEGKEQEKPGFVRTVKRQILGKS